jgi:hypothetical protein
MRTAAIVIGVLTLSPAWAEESPLDIQSDIDARYFLVEKAGSPEVPILVIRREGPSGTRYSRRELDCAARTVKSLGSAESLEALAGAEPDASAFPVEEGSIADQLWKHACP